jgi:hypothetical protein
VALFTCMSENCQAYGNCAGINVPGVVAQYKQTYINWLKANLAVDAVGGPLGYAGARVPAGATLYDYAAGNLQPITLQNSGSVTSTGLPATTSTTQPGTIPSSVTSGPQVTGGNIWQSGNVLNPPIPGQTNVPSGSIQQTTGGTPALTNNGGQAAPTTPSTGMSTQTMLLLAAGAAVLLFAMKEK